MYAIKTTYLHKELAFKKEYINTKNARMLIFDNSGDKFSNGTPFKTVESIVRVDGYKTRSGMAFKSHIRLKEREEARGNYYVAIEWVEF